MMWAMGEYLAIGTLLMLGSYAFDTLVGPQYAKLLSFRENAGLIAVIVLLWPLVLWWYLEEVEGEQ
jgi:hypothetical protein